VLSASGASIPPEKTDEKIKYNNQYGINLLENAEDLISHRWFGMFDSNLAQSIPRINIQELPDRYHVEADLPGVKKEDVEIILKDDFLIINGQRKSMNEVNKEKYLRVERSNGTFYRAVLMPSGIDKDKISAELSEGVLKVDIMKNKEARHFEKKILLK
jgi:HSP20 family protein